jgi:hypothetical protein
MLSWRKLNDQLSSMTEAQVLELLDFERKGPKRVVVLERLHQRYSTLRTARERAEILKEAAK